MSASCQSLTSQLIKVTGDYLKKYQEFRKSAAKIFVSTIIPGKAGSDKELEKLIDQAFDLQTEMWGTYNKLTGEGGGKIGARNLTIPTKKVTGDLVTERTFIIAASPFDIVTIEIKKTGGKAGADIAACAKHPNGDPFDKKERSIEKGKDEKGDTVTMVFKDVANKPMTLHLVKRGFVTDTCDYTVSLEGKFDEEVMKKIGSKKTPKRAAAAK